ncbi:type II secretion system GspH family protein [Desulfuromonas sp. KJ2020]|uniref:pilus assembly FimT family protein n=1 Tax=Desulfuromonas sp. KJ2020 TaxID=2919173 RepID=UPI0020A7761C|nr:type II secretion system protein [Desulfuromonas sp. KJ2020]MCP3177391.1 type II secretion system GspH family protein [Desulfuromonas sp. KJ2020]
MNYSPQGFTLLELMVTLVVTVGLLAVSLPIYGAWLDKQENRAAARAIAGALREARAAAVAHHREHRVKFVAPPPVSGQNPSFLFQRGNLSRNSTEWEDLTSNNPLPEGLFLRFTQSCVEDVSPRYLSFNPDGSSNSLYLCLGRSAGGENERTFAVGVSHSSTGRVTILRWNAACSCFQ